MNEIKRIFYLYKIYSTRINSPDLTSIVSTDKEINKKLNYWNCFVKYINIILDKIKPENKKIIIEIFLNNKRPTDLHYSVSTYYVKRKNAMKEFYDYFSTTKDDTELSKLLKMNLLIN